jgi:two-component system chemotaxis sensor kinase CheA
MTTLSPKRVRELFAQEAEVRLADLGRLLLELERTGGEQAGDGEPLIRTIYREIHTLKGSSAVAGLDEVSRCAHLLEEVVDDLAGNRREVTPDVIDVLLAGADQLTALVMGTSLEDGSDGQPPATPDAPDPLAATPGPADRAPAVDAPAPGGLPSAAVTAASEPPPPERPPPRSDKHGAGPVIMVPTERLEELTRLVGEAAAAHLRVGRMLNDRFQVDPASCAEFNELDRTLHDLQDRTMRAQMVPVATITDQLQRAVRDLSRTQGKDIRWDARGTDTEMDRAVLHRLSDSLLHLIRNAVDHGIETPAERVAAGKPAFGTIRLHAMQLGSEVIITVTDDGRGIDVDAVSEQAGRRGIDTVGLAEHDLLGLTFQPGLSTAGFVTDVSGRGVGLDVVRSNVEAARGRVEVRSTRGAGAEFRIIVPITQAVLRCLLIEAGSQSFALPFHRVVLSQAHDAAEIGHAEGRPVVWVEGTALPLSVLAETLGIADGEPAVGPIVVLADTSRRHAFRVDRLVGQRDVVFKGLSTLLPRLPAVAGASVEPDGSVLVVLDPPSLIERARRSTRVDGLAPTTERSSAPRRRILVVDDALTVRELQRSILERAGFDVRVASDGSQAMAALAEQPSDLVLTDVEMPIMDGFALTEAIRAQPSLTNIPVLILSSRSTDADRQRGLDAGADGYIIKSGFDEASLLSAVDRLLGATP